MDTKIQKPDNREYTLKVIPHQGGDVRSISISLKKIKCAAAVICTGAVLFIGVFAYSTYNASLVEQDKAELNDLRQVNNIQQTQILQLSKKTAGIQSEMEQLEQLENDLRQLTGAAATEKKSKKNDGQGGPGIKPNVDNLNETLDILAAEIQTRRANLESLKSGLVQQREQLAITPSIWPASGEVSSRYGLRWGGSDFHPGIDIAADEGTPVVATADGVIVESGWNSGGYGYMVDIDHGNGIITRYGHNSQLAVSVGTAVKKGQVIAYVGNTGFSTGPHLHYEVRVNGRAVNPDKYLQ